MKTTPLGLLMTAREKRLTHLRARLLSIDLD